MRHTNALYSNKMIWVMIIPIVIILCLSFSTASYLTFKGNQTHGINLSGSGTLTENSGLVIYAKYNITLVNVTRATGVTGNIFNITNMSNYQLFTANFTSNNLNLNYNLTAGNYYKLTLKNITTWTHICNMSLSYYDSQYITWNGGVFNNANYTNAYFCNFLSVGINATVYSQYLTNSLRYDTTTFESQSNNLLLNITYNSSEYLSSSAVLYYNNTAYSSTKTEEGSNTLFSNTVTSPSVSATTNISFYWTVALTNTSGQIAYYNTSFYNQSVINLAIDDCSSYTNKIINFSMFDEDNPAQRLTSPANNNSISLTLYLGDSTLSNYNNLSLNKSNVNSLSICSQYAINGTLRMDYSLIYSSTNRNTESYNVKYYNLTSATTNQNISLYDLLTTSASTFLINVKDQNYINLQGAIVQIYRYYNSLGQSLLVEAPITDSLGNTFASMISSNALYNIYIWKNGVLLGTFNNIQVYCVSTSCTLYLSLSGSSTTPDDFNTYLGTTYTINYNVTTGTYILNYIASDSTSKTVRLTASLYDDTSICDTTTIGVSGSPTCVFSSTYANKTAFITAYVNGEKLYLDSVYIGTTQQQAGGNLRYTGYILGAMLIPFFVIIAGASAPMAIIFYLLGLFVTVTMGLLNGIYIGTGSFIIWFIVAGAVILWKVNNGRQNG